MTTPLLLLRAVQLGVHISKMDLLTIGTLLDMYSEMSIRRIFADFQCKVILMPFNE